MPYNAGVFTLTYTFGTGTPANQQTIVQIGNALDDLASSIAIANLIAEGVTAGAAGLLQTDFISGGIVNPANQDYRIIEKIPYGATLTEFTGKTSTGTLTATLKIGTTAVTNGALSVTSAQSTTVPSAANVMVAGNVLVITISAVSSPANFTFTVKYTYSLV